MTHSFSGVVVRCSEGLLISVYLTTAAMFNNNDSQNRNITIDIVYLKIIINNESTFPFF